ncbi:MAG: biopolymer transporter ExbD [Bdellovibrio sp.]
MIDFGLDHPPRKKYLNDLNIVPILDMFVAIIFFLLLTTSFVGLTKLQVPPSAVSTITDPSIPPPVSPKLYLWSQDTQLRIQLKWQGVRPGEKLLNLDLDQVRNTRALLTEKIRPLLVEFKSQHPTERTLQLSLESRLPFQSLIEVMDAARESLPDIVLLSPDEVAVLQNRGTT